MSDFKQLIERNTEFSQGFSHGSLPIMPEFLTIVLTCVDARVDPAHFLALQPGELVVVRNLGGRVNDSAIESIAILDTLAQKLGGGKNVEVAVVHHNDCGVSRFSNPQLQQVLAQRINRDPSVIQEMVIVDPNESATADVELLKSSPLLGPAFNATGYVYDVTTGTLEKARSVVAAEVE